MTISNPTILIVDDDSASLYLRGRILRQAGFTVIEAQTGAECLRLVASVRPALVLLDMNLPDILGSEVCRRIKQDPAYTSVFVLHISASLISPYDKAHALEYGADGYLIEPVEPVELLATVRALLRLQRAETLLRESEARLRLGLSMVGVALAEVDYTTNMIRLSPEAAALYGLPAEPALVPRQRVHDCFHPEDRLWLLPQIEQVLDPQGRGVLDVEHRVVLPDGAVRWVQVRKQVFFASDRDGTLQPVRSLLAAFDITERKASEAQLRFHAGLLDHAHDAILVTDTGRRITVWNRGAEQMLGWSADEVLGRLAHEVVRSSFNDEQRNQILHVLATTGVYRHEVTLHHRDGTPMIIEAINVVLRDAGSQITGYLAINRDVTAHKQAEEAIRISELRFRHMANAMPAIVLTCDPAGNITFANHRWAKYTSQTPGETAELGVWPVIHPDDVERERALWQTALASGQPYESEYRLRRHDGVYRWHREWSEPEYNAQGRVLQWLHNIIDIEERKAAEDALRQANSRFERAERAAHGFAFESDLVNGLVVRSANFSRVTGYALHEVPATPEGWLQLIHPDDRASFKVEDLLASGRTSYTGDYRVRHKDGYYLWVQEQGLIERDEQGQPRTIVGMTVDISARRAGQEALRASQAELRTILDNIPAAVYMLSPDHRYLYVNRLFAESYHQKETHIVGRSVFDRFPPEVAKTLVANEQRVLESRTPLTIEESAPRNGELHHYTTVKAPMVDSTGEPYAVIGISLDITEHKRAQEALRASEERYRQIFEQTVVGIDQATVDGKLLAVNPGFCQMLGYSADELLAINSFDLTHPDDRALTLQMLGEVQSKQRDSYTLEKRLLHKEGHAIWVSLTATAVRDATGNILFGVAITQDIRARKEAEAALRQSEARLNAILQNIPASIYMLTPDQHYLYINRQYEQLVKITNAEIQGYSLYDLFEPETAAALAANDLRALAARAPLHLEELIPQGGEMRTYASILAPLLDENDAPYALLGISTDITERKRSAANQQFLFDLGIALRRLSDPVAIQQMVVKRLGQYLEASRCRFNAVDLAGDKASLLASWSQPGLPPPAEVPPISSYASPAYIADAQAGRTLVVYDIHQDQRAETAQMRLRQQHFPAAIRVPCLRHGQWVASLHVLQNTPRQWRPDEVQLVESVVQHFWPLVEKARNEAALRASEERYRTLFESMDEGFCILEMIFDAEGQPLDYRFLETNPAFERFTGLYQAVGKTALQLVPNLEQHWFEIYGQVAMTGEARRFVENSPAMGRWFDVYAFRHGGPESRKVALLFTDISERKEAENEVARSRNLLQRMATVSPDNITIYDLRQERIIFSNRGLGIGDVSGPNSWQRTPAAINNDIHPDDIARVQAEFQRIHTAADGEVVETIFRWRHPDGGYRWLQERTMVFDRDEQGQVTQYLSISTDITERKQAEANLRQQAMLLDQAHDAIIVWTLNGGIRYWNRGAEELYGWASHEALGQVSHQLLQTVHPISVAEFEQTLRQHGYWSGEVRHCTRTGKQLIVESRYVVMQQEDGVYVVLETNRDNTERKRHEERLAFNTYLLENMQDAVIAFDADYRVTAWNRGAELLYGYTAREAMDASIIELLHPVSTAEQRTERIQAMAHSQYVRVETLHHHRNGTPIAIEAISIALPDDGNGIRSYLTINRDITERKAREAALLVSQQRLQLALAAAQMGVWELDIAAQRVYWSPEVYQLSGVTDFDGSVAGADRVVHPDDLPAAQAKISQAIEQHLPYQDEYRVIHADGRVHWLAAQGRVEYAADGAPLHVRAVIQDVTARKQAELNRQFLLDLDAKIRPLGDVDALLALTAQTLAQYLNVAHCTFNEINLDTDWGLALMHWRRNVEWPNLTGLHKLSTAMGLEMAAMLGSGQSVTVNDVEHDPHTAALVDRYAAVHVQSIARTPFKLKDTLLAVLAVADDQPRTWQPDEVRLLEEVIARVWPLVIKARAERELRRQEEFVRQIADNVPGLVGYLGRDESYRFVNATFEAWFQRPRQEIINGTAFQLLGEEGYERFGGYRKRALAGENVTYEDTLSYPDGVTRAVWGRHQPDIAADGTVQGFYLFVMDISERRQAEADAHFLADLAEQIRLADDAAALLWTVSQQIGDYLQVGRAHFIEVNQASNRMLIHRDYCRGLPSVAGDFSISAYSVDTWSELAAGRTLVNEDTEHDPRTAAIYATTYEPAQEGAGIAVPLLRNGECQGIFSITMPSARQWQPREIQLLETVAERVWLAVEKLRLDAERRRSQEQLRQIADNLPGLISVINSQHEYEFVNQNYQRWLGVETSKIIGQPKRTVIGEAAYAVEQPYLARALAGETVTFENRLATTDGDIHDLMVTVVPRRGDNQQVQGCYVMALDITERKQAEESLQQSNAILNGVLESSNDAIFVRDLAGRYLLTNRMAAEQVQMSQEQMIGRRYDELFRADEVAAMHLEDELILQQGQRVTVEHLTQFDNVIRHWHTVKVPLRNAAGQIIGLLSSARDITERKEAEEALRQSEEVARQRLAELEVIYDTAPIGLCVLDQDLRWLRINERLAAINGFSVAEHLGHTVAELLPSIAPTVQQWLRQVMETNQPLLNIELQGETPSQPGVKRTWREHCFPLHAQDGRVVGINIVAEEITERKRQEHHQQFLDQLFTRLRLLSNTKTMLEQVVTSLGQHLAVDSCRINAIDAAHETFTVQENWGGKRVVGANVYPLTELAPPAIVAALGAGETVVVANTAIDLRTAPVADVYSGADVASLIGVPIFYEGVWRATLSVRNQGERHWYPDEVRLLETVAHQFSALLEKVRAEEALRRSEMRYRTIFENAGASLWEEDFSSVQQAVNELTRGWRAAGMTDLAAAMRQHCAAHPEFVQAMLKQVRILDVNQETVRLYGVSKAELLKPFEQFFAPETLVRFVDELVMIASGGGRYTFDGPIQTPEGETRHLAFTVVFPQEAEGKLDRVLVSGLDVTALKETEDQLRASEERLRLALEAGNMAAFEYILATKSVRRSANAQALQGLGEYDVGDNYYRYVHADERAELRRRIDGITPQQPGYEYEYRFQRPDNDQTIWLLDRGQGIFDARGRLQRLTGMVIDISERRRREAQGRFLADLGETMVHIQRPEELLGEVAQRLGEFLGVSRSFFLENAPEQEAVLVHHNYYRPGLASMAGVYPKADFDPNSLAAMTAGRAVVVHNTESPPVTARQNQNRYDPFNIRTIVSIPLLRNEQWMAGLVVIDDEPRQWREEDVNLIRTVAERAWLAVENRRLFQETETLLAQLEAMLDNVPIGLAFFDEQSRFVRLNPAMASMNNHAVAEHLNRPLSELLPTSSARLLPWIQQVFATGQGVYNLEMSWPLPRNPGAVGYTLISYYPIKVGNATRFVGCSALDITDRKRAEEEVRHLNTELQARLDEMNTLLEILPTGVRIGNADCSEITGNPAAYQIMGITPDINASVTADQPEVPSDLRLFVNDVEVLPADAPMQQVARTGRPCYNFKHELRFTDGTRKTVYASIVPLFDQQGEVRKVIGAYMDISALKEAEDALRQLNATLDLRVQERTAELERSNRELDKFAYVASHDLKSPLRAIENLAQWISSDAGSVLPDQSKVHLEKMQGRVRRMEKLLDDLLAYSRAGRHQYKIERVNVQQLVQDAIDLLAFPPGFTFTLDIDVPVYIGQRVPLETVLRNLIGNAIKHHDRPGGQVWVTAQDQGDRIEFAVRDDGPGIDPKFHERIFEMFQTLQPRDKVEGSGMGLAIVKKLIENLGGTITVESTEGAGATFRWVWNKA